MSLTRRRFLGRAAPLGLFALLPACSGADAEMGAERAASPFVHGVASGDPLANGVILWTPEFGAQVFDASILRQWLPGTGSAE